MPPHTHRHTDTQTQTHRHRHTLSAFARVRELRCGVHEAGGDGSQEFVLKAQTCEVHNGGV